MVYSNISMIDQKGVPYPYKRWERSHCYSGWVFKELLLENFIPSPTVLLRKKCLEKVGLFDSQLDLAEDWDLWLRISYQFRLYYIDKALALYRWREHSPEYLLLLTESCWKILVKLLSNRLIDQSLYPVWKKSFLKHTTKILFYSYDLLRISKVKKYFWESIKISPTLSLHWCLWRWLLKSLLGERMVKTFRDLKTRVQT